MIALLFQLHPAPFPHDHHLSSFFSTDAAIFVISLGALVSLIALPLSLALLRLKFSTKHPPTLPHALEHTLGEDAPK